MSDGHQSGLSSDPPLGKFWQLQAAATNADGGEPFRGHNEAISLTTRPRTRYALIAMPVEDVVAIEANRQVLAAVVTRPHDAGSLVQNALWLTPQWD
jgi:hypothetical protein